MGKTTRQQHGVCVASTCKNGLCLLYLDMSWGKDGQRGGWVLILFGKCFPLQTHRDASLPLRARVVSTTAISPGFYWMSIPLQSVRLEMWQFLSFYWFRERGKLWSRISSIDRGFASPLPKEHSNDADWLLGGVVRMNWWPSPVARTIATHPISS